MLSTHCVTYENNTESFFAITLVNITREQIRWYNPTHRFDYKNFGTREMCLQGQQIVIEFLIDLLYFDERGQS